MPNYNYSVFDFTVNFLNENAKVCLVNDRNGDIVYEGYVKDMKGKDLLGRQFVEVQGLGNEKDLIIFYRNKEEL